MSFNIGQHYKIIININNVTLTYSCKVISEDEYFFTILDKFGKEYTFNKKLVIQIEKIDGGKFDVSE